jgi:uncharacterized protein (TIGR02231 family)
METATHEARETLHSGEGGHATAGHPRAEGRQALTALLPVAEVTLLEDRARVVRRGRISLPAGQVRVRIEGVAPVLSDKSLVVRIAPSGSTDSAARCVDVRCDRTLAVWQTAPVPDSGDPAGKSGNGGGAIDAATRLLRLQAEQRTLAAHIAALDTDRAAIEREAAALEQVAALTFAELAADISWGRELGDAGPRLDALRDRERDARQALVEVIAILAERRRDAERLAARLRAAESHAPVETALLTCELVVDRPGDFDLAISYLVPGACWRPYHEARLTDSGAGSRVELATDACIWQSTGEDWVDASLRFSTERASLGTEPPPLSTDLLRVQRKSEVVAVEMREQEIETTGLGAAGRAAAELPGIDDGGLAIELRAPVAATVRSDGRPHRVRLGSFQSDAEVELVAMPELSPCVLTRTTQSNRGSGPLLAGPVDLIRDSGLTGRTSILFIAAGERFELGWGPDPDLRLHRDVERHHEASGTLSSWNETRHEIEIRLSNLGPRPRTVRVTERIPVSEIDKVKIALEPDLGRPRAVDDDGRIDWKVSLEPFGHTAIELTYIVKKHDSVVGI